MSLAKLEMGPIRIETVKRLPFPDQHYLNSALGWLELGNHAEAHAEAERISGFGRTHQDAFLVRWRIAGHSGNWQEAYRVATTYTEICPRRVVGWICLSYSLYRLCRPLEAWMQLLPKAREFSHFSAIPYILACYAREMGNHAVARRFLSQSQALGGPRKVADRALGTDDIDVLLGSLADPATESPKPPHPSHRLNRDTLGFGS